MRAPQFWGRPPGTAAALLSPAAAVWRLAGRWQQHRAHPYRPPVPVVCVGNIVAGGAGKTPVVLSLAALLAARGIAVHIVSRGYGGSLSRGAPTRVDPRRHDAATVGDEALLLATRAPCWIGADRAAAARAAAASGAALLLLDDGLQNPAIAKDLSLLVVDAEYGLGNGKVMPAGPLREPPQAGLARAGALVLIGAAAPPPLLAAAQHLLRARLAPIDGDRFTGARVVAFAGIGRPEKFFATLAALGAVPVQCRGFPDHHPYRDAELAGLRRAAAADGARLVTTAKDFMRLLPRQRDGIERLDVEIVWDDPAAPTRLLEAIVLSPPDHGRIPIAE